LLPAGALRRVGLSPTGTTSPFHGAHPKRKYEENARKSGKPSKAAGYF
jgi:hypothetical protein